MSTSPPGGHAPLRCVVVEDQMMFLQLLVAMLRSIEGLEVMATAQTAAAGVAACLEVNPDLLILDLSLPDQDGIVVARALAQHNPGARVIVLSAAASSFVCDATVQPILQAVVDKIDLCDTLIGEIEALLGRHQPAPAPDVLTNREQEVLMLIGQGLTSKQIALELQLAPFTVSTHRRNIIAKLGIKGGALVRHATLQAIQNNGEEP